MAELYLQDPAALGVGVAASTSFPRPRRVSVGPGQGHGREDHKQEGELQSTKSKSTNELNKIKVLLTFLTLSFIFVECTVVSRRRQRKRLKGARGKFPFRRNSSVAQAIFSIPTEQRKGRVGHLPPLRWKTGSRADRIRLPGYLDRERASESCLCTCNGSLVNAVKTD